MFTEPLYLHLTEYLGSQSSTSRLSCRESTVQYSTWTVIQPTTGAGAGKIQPPIVSACTGKVQYNAKTIHEYSVTNNRVYMGRFPRDGNLP